MSVDDDAMERAALDRPPVPTRAAYVVAPPAAITPAIGAPTGAPDGLTTIAVDVALPSVPVDRVEVATSVAADALGGAVRLDPGPLPARRAMSTDVAEAAPRVTDLPRTNEEPAIRALLEQYGTAYSRLDARAARAVWPAVDVQALARAFDALESQDIDFEQCEVQVDGAAAHAACRGTSTWVPRVGERRPRRDAREWTFRLARDRDAQWRIQSASMR